MIVDHRSRVIKIDVHGDTNKWKRKVEEIATMRLPRNFTHILYYQLGQEEWFKLRAKTQYYMKRLGLSKVIVCIGKKECYQVSLAVIDGIETSVFGKRVKPPRPGQRRHNVHTK